MDAVRSGALAQVAWVPPSEAALLTLARGGSAAWSLVRRDPGIVLLLLRLPQAREHFAPTSLIDSPTVLETALKYLGDEPALLDWTHPRRAAVLSACLAYAAEAEMLAGRVPSVDPDRAWTAGLLAPLGRIAVAAHAPDTPCADWEQSELTRRLVRRWELPHWLGATISHLGLPPDVAVQLGAERELFALTQLAILRVQKRGTGLDLAVGARPGELLRLLGLPPRLEAASDVPPPSVTPLSLTEFLTLECETRQLRARGMVGLLEEELDALHSALEQQRGREEERLREGKLKALAEFAGGAGHEINNPLAVISCQAELLLRGTEAPESRASLEKIIAQTRRIHTLLRDLMQFARPAAPVRRRLDLVRLIDEVLTSLAGLAHAHQVRLHFREDGPTAPLPCPVDADEKQVRTALTCLLRNAIEAAGAEGWVRLHLGATNGLVSVAIEDSGPGLSETQREHLFDPFYSGRSAGRGPGLGLPTAWALTRQQGGAVVLTSQPGEPTRFELRLPPPSAPNGALAG